MIISYSRFRQLFGLLTCCDHNIIVVRLGISNGDIERVECGETLNLTRGRIDGASAEPPIISWNVCNNSFIS